MIYAPVIPIALARPNHAYPVMPVVARTGAGLLGVIMLLSLLAVLMGGLLASCARPISFLSMREGNWDVYAMDTRVQIVYNLTHNPTDDYFAAWSPDGTRLAFRSARGNN